MNAPPIRPHPRRTAARWLRHLRRLRRLLQPRRAVPVARVAAAHEIELELPDERPLGCGWFDSSHDLRQGLSVQEHDTLGAVAGDLPLAAWVDWQLAGWRPTLQP